LSDSFHPQSSPSPASGAFAERLTQGNEWLQQGQVAEAIACFREVLRSTPDCLEAWNNLGNAYRQAGLPTEAIAAFEQALRLAPQHGGLYNNLGNVYFQQQAWEESQACFERAIHWSPQLTAAYANLAMVQEQTGDWAGGLRTFEAALNQEPANPELWHRLGAFYRRFGKLAQAIQALKIAISHPPVLAKSLSLLGCVLQESGQLLPAVRCLQQAWKLEPQDADIGYNLANTYKLLNNHSAAAEAYRNAVRLDPRKEPVSWIHQRQFLCDWEGIEELTAQAIAAIEGPVSQQPFDPPIPPFAFLSLPLKTTPAQQRLCAERYTQRWLQTLPPIARYTSYPRLTTAQASPPKLRLGYLSADFSDHAVGYMLPELFESHDRSRFTVFAYATSPEDGSPIRGRLRRSVDHFVELEPLSLAEAAERIYRDQIDILIDLQGYTAAARLGILAYRPAPIQIAYLGYPGTSGTDFLDYILVDRYVVPLHQQPFFSEKLLYLPGCYQVNDSRHACHPETPTRHACHLPEESFVFCAFNSSYKISPAIFGSWMRILNAVPSSLLWLAEDHPQTRGNLQQQALRLGVEPSRLIFADRIPIDRHLPRHAHADLFLDTFPYNAHATASIALRMGVPIITVSGETMASRVAGSLLSHLGLEELIAENLDAYERLAICLATQPEELRRLRRKLSTALRTTDLFQGRQFAEKLEAVLWQLWNHPSA
jgi:protein O-GlcNAc transferase